MKFGDVLTYHCQCCGSNMDVENGKCWYCGSTKMVRIPKRKNTDIRMFADLGDRKFYFHEIDWVAGISPTSEVIDCTTLESGEKHYIHGMSDNSGIWTAHSLLTTDTGKKISLINEKNKPIRLGIEIPGLSSIFAFSAYLENPDIEASPQTVPKVSINFVIDGVEGWRDNNFNVVAEGTSCPNCGAKVTKEFGLCDYCGGWIEYNDRF